MKPPLPSRSERGESKKIPTSRKPVSPGPTPAPRSDAVSGDAEPTVSRSAEQSPDAGADMPRLTRLSSLRSRGAAGRSSAPPSGPADATDDNSAAGGTGQSFRRRDGEAAKSFGAGIVVRLRPADKCSRSTRRAGSRGALAVVGTVGLLAVVSALVTVSLIGSSDDKDDDGASTVVGSDNYGSAGAVGHGDLPRSADAAASASGTAVAEPPKPKTGSPTSTPASGKTAAPKGKPAAPATGSAAPLSDPQSPLAGVSVVNHDSDRCIDIAGGEAVEGAQLMIYDCSSTSASQHWKFPTDGTMRGLGMCVQLAGKSTANGTDLELAPCNGGSAQRFTLNSSHDLVNGPADKCVDVRDNGTANGTPLQLWSCAGSDNQKWSKA